MATITSTIKLVDQMTPTLNKISKAIDSVSRRADNLATSVEKANARANASNRAQANEEKRIAQEKARSKRIADAQYASMYAQLLNERDARERESARAEKQAQAEIIADRRLKAQMAKRLELEERREAQATARAEKQAAREALAAEKAADRKAMQSAREKARLERQLAQDTANKIAKIEGLANAGFGRTRSIASGILSAFNRLALRIGTFISARAFAETADTMMNARARIDNINDGLYSTNQYMQMIYESAQRSRGSFTDMATQVAKLGNVAGSAFGGNVSSIIKFSELLNKSFRIAGASAAESSNAAYQLTQALAAGKLQGDEMKSILENAPLVAQKIAKKMGVTVGKVKELGAEGKITSDVIIEAMFEAADEIEKRFGKLPKTLGDIWTEISNYATNKFRPVFDKIQRIINGAKFTKLKNKLMDLIGQVADGVLKLMNVFNTEKVQAGISKITTSLTTLMGVAKQVGDTMVNVAIWIADNWSWIVPIVAAVVGVIVIFNIVSAIASVVSFLFSSGLLATAASGGVVITTMGWIVLAIAAVILFIYWAVAAWNRFSGESVSATGVILGSIAFLGAAIWDILYVTFVVVATIVVAVAYVISIIVRSVILAFHWVCNVIHGIVGFIEAIWGDLGSNIKGTLIWLGEVIKIWGSNVKSGFSQICDQLPLYALYASVAISAKFYDIVASAIEAFNSLLQNSKDTCIKMLTPFAEFADGVKKLFNKIKSLWNGLMDKIATGFTVPADLVAFGEFCGVDVPDNIGIPGANNLKFDIDETPITAEGWINGIDELANEWRAKADMMAGAANLVKDMIKPIDWGTTDYPALSEYADWAGMWENGKQGWKEGYGTHDLGADLAGFEADWNQFKGMMAWLYDDSHLIDPVGAYKNWYTTGEAVDNGVAGIVETIGALLEGMSEDKDPAKELAENNKFAIDSGMDYTNLKPLDDPWKDIFGNANGGAGDTLGSIADNTGSAAGSAANIEDTLDLAEEELELLRKLAEQEVINRFTTAEIHVDMTNNNNISSKMDLDGIVTHLSNKLYEELGVVASGVHY